MTTWFITGTSSGIGRHLTEQLLARGDRVAATLRRADRLSELAARYPETLWPAELDVTDTAAIREVVGRAFGQLGLIDVVVSNAGYGVFGAGEEVTDDQIGRQIDTNIIGSIQLIRAVLPYLRAQGGGRVIQVSSEGGQIAYPNFSLYHTSKWAIEGFVESVAKEVAPFGIEFTLVEPGPTRTNFGASLDQPEPMPAYEKTPAGDIRRALTRGEFAAYGDPVKMARAIIESAAQQPAPLRLLLGKDAFDRVRGALTDRIAALDAQRDVALSTEIDKV